MNQEQTGIKKIIEEIKQEQVEIKNELQEFETKGEERHKEVMDRFTSIERDQDFIWEKTARNEREIANIKRQLS